jgi:hypothetical protein
MIAKKPVITVGRVWQREFLDFFVSPRRYRRTTPELRHTCDPEEKYASLRQEI